MIDYEKLEKAIELCNKIKSLTCDSLILTTHAFFDGHGKLHMKLTLHKAPINYDFYNLDDLIAKLEELVKPEPKYQVGQKIWVQSLQSECENVLSMHAFEGTVIPCKPCDYGLSEPYVRVIAGNDEYSSAESFCFPTRQALIEHQIQYWKSLLEDEIEQHVSPYAEPQFEGEIKGFGYDGNKFDGKADIDKCQHKSSGYTKIIESQGLAFDDVAHKCIKCGELYK